MQMRNSAKTTLSTGTPLLPRFLVVLPTLEVGGAEVVTLKRLRRRALGEGDYHLVTLFESRGTTCGVPDHVTLHTLGCRNVAQSVARLARLIRTLKPDVIDAHIIFAGIAAAGARVMARSDAALVVSEHGMPPTAEARSGVSRRATLWLMRRAYRRADAVIAVSDAVGDYLCRCVPALTPRVRVIYNPVVDDDLPALAAAPSGHPWLDDGVYSVVLAVGRLTPAKNLPLLVDAFAVLAESNPSARLVIVGEGAAHDDLAEQIDRLSLAGVAQLVGYRENPFSFMSRAAVLAHAASTESFGNVLVEALACGTPVVALAASGGSAETFAGPPLGWWLTDRSPNAFAAGIAQAMTAPDAGEARRHHAARFNAARGDGEYREAIATVLARRDRRVGAPRA